MQKKQLIFFYQTASDKSIQKPQNFFDKIIFRLQFSVCVGDKNFEV